MSFKNGRWKKAELSFDEWPSVLVKGIFDFASNLLRQQLRRCTPLQSSSIEKQGKK